IFQVFYPIILLSILFFFSSRRRHTSSKRDWSSDVCSSDLILYLVFHILLFQTIFLSNHSDEGYQENNVGYLGQAKLAPFLDSLMLFLHVVKASSQFADLDIFHPQQVPESSQF